MSVFSNPASSAPEHAAAYVAALLDLLGDLDSMVVLRSTPNAISHALTDVPEHSILTPEAPGKWSVGEMVSHLADSELVFGYRLRMILAHERPQLAGYDQDLWADRLQYGANDYREALALFGALRAANIKLLQRASPEDLRRVSVHVERGEERLDHMIKLYAAHDLLHIRQLQRILTTVQPA